jgi:signal transduction histidine kinase/ActR/RegA family two-component response regulator
MSTSVLKSDGGRVHVLALIEDITEQKRMEAEQREMELRLQQIEKAEALSRMAGAIAHHFNNQLMVILGNLDLAGEHCQEDENARRNLIAMKKATQKAAEVSHLMLIYAGSDFEKKDAIDLNEFCNTQVPAIEASLPNHIRLNTAFPEPGLNALVNVGQIQQALMHLITNAVEAIGDRPGTIHVSLGTMSGSDIPAVHRYPVDRQPRADGAYVCIVVSDTGCGIADDDLHRIMDPFFTSKFTGRGMGLAFVLGILRGHDGFLCVESEPQRGSTFRIFLPRVEAKAAIQPVSMHQQPDFHAEGQVLVVEDEPLVLDVTEMILKRLGFTVVRAANGLEALHVFEKSPEQFRFVISDLAMEYLDGWELLSAMRRIRPDIPVILASGYNEAHVLKGEHADLPQAILEKPYQIQQLIAAIQKIIDSQHA